MTGGLLGAGPAAALEAREADDRLDEVVVTVSGFEQSVVDAPASITILSREALTGQRSHSLTEALADVEGIDTGDTAGKTGGLNISLRGMPSDYTLVLIVYNNMQEGRRLWLSANFLF
ncbi:MAG: TonB-dependent receptor plug domain-containing protein [Steroidobacteraceae bacterium]|nr:TonB-dependent receptor plug domain-containing protein [Steroidobacteraceae bacterium]